MKWVAWVFFVLLALPAIAGLGFYLRPVSYLNAHVYLQEHFLGIESRNIKVDGYRVHYLATGPVSGPPVVLVHGLGGRAEDWWNVAPVLAKAGFRVYMPDLLGFGRSQQPADFSYSVRDQAAIVVASWTPLASSRLTSPAGPWVDGSFSLSLRASRARLPPHHH